MALKSKITDTTIALIWDKESFEEAFVYQIYCDQELKSSVKSNNYTLKKLESDKEYKVKVEAVALDGRLLQVIGEASVKTLKALKVLSITDFGAVGDGKTLNTKAIQDAINACPVDGKVVIPEGDFVSGALHLKSNMTLCIKQDGILRASDSIEDFPIYEYRFEGLNTRCYASLLNGGIKDGERLENVVIEGHGAIDANGSVLRQLERDERAGQPGRAVVIQNGKNIYFKDIVIKHSPAWCLHLIFCEDVCCNHVRIYTKFDENGNPYTGICNGDGIVVDSCRHVHIFHSMVASQDDCISIKSGRNSEGRSIAKPSEHIHITDCLFKSGFGVSIGSEMSAGVRDVTIRECVFQNTYSILSIKAPRPRGGVVDGVICEDCIHFNYDTIYEDCEWFRGAIYIDQFYSYKNYESDEKKPVSEATPCIQNVTFRNIDVDTITGNAIFIVGLPEMPIKNLVLNHVKAKGKSGMVIRNVEGIEQKNISIVLHNEKL